MFSFGLSNAQNKKIEVKFNPVGILFGRPELSGEYLLNENFGAELTLNTAFGETGTGISINGVESEKPTQSGFGFKIAGKYYFDPKEQGGDGWYVGLYLRQESASLKYSKTDALNYKSNVFAGGFEVGKKWVFDSGFLIEAGIGLGKPFSETREFSTPGLSDNVKIELGFDFTGKLALGYRF